MKIIDLTPQYDSLYHLCLEDWSPEIKEAGDHKARWHQVMKEKGLRVKLALDQQDEVGGMIQYLPIEKFFCGREPVVFGFMHLGSWSQKRSR